MKYYKIAPLSRSPLLSYASELPLQIGELVQIPIRKDLKTGVVWEECPPPEFDCKQAQSQSLFLLPHQLHLAHFIAQYYCSSLGKALSLFVPYSKFKSPLKLELSQAHQLSNQQEQALDFISQRSLSLLFGETGSGKSEIYIHLIARTLKQGKTALLLMPEISLTPQMQQRLQKVFGQHLGLWHSKMSKGKRQQVLEGIQEGKIRLVLGARSALFLPMPNLGLLIIDEEHDDAYKAQNSPRYNARDLALYLGTKHQIPVLLGSATPSLPSYHLADSRGAIFRLPKFHPSKNEFLFLKEKSGLTDPILESIDNTLSQGKQAIIFLPTRANFKYLLCSSCGGSIHCPFCSISMSLHKNKNAMLCHYCGYAQSIPQHCPHCQNPELVSERIGTVQIAQELQQHFPKHSIAIFDRDHISTQSKLESTLKSFAKHKIDILVGTQMLSKGHDYHNIGLAVIMGLDSILGLGDFRARERAMSLFFQIQGRVGRKENGKVIVQTLNPLFFTISRYEDFLRSESRFREGLYPPFLRLATLTFSHPHPQKAQQQMLQALSELQDAKEIQIVGSGKAMIEKIHSKYRFIILLRSHKSTALIQAIRNLTVVCEIDIDPLNIV